MSILPDDDGFAVADPFRMEIQGCIQSVVSRGHRLAIIALVFSAICLARSGMEANENAAEDADSAKKSVIWPHFRGPGALGHAVKANPPISWSVKDGRNMIWKVKIPKPGMNSPVVWGKRLFLTGADEESRQIYCIETDTGKLLWQHDVDGIAGSPSKEELPNVMQTSGLAAPTATTNGRHVAAIFATGDLICLNMEGRRIWAKNLGIPRNQYGHASSLISHENVLFVQYDQEKDSKLLTFDLASGNLIWQAKRSAISWSSPVFVENKGRMELILTNCEGIDSYDPKTGRLLWNMKGLRGEVAPSVAYADGVVYVANEYSAAFAIEIGSHGSKPKILWQWTEILPDVASPLANKDYLIMPSGYGIISCLEAKTGKVCWENEFDNGFYSSPILVNDRVYIIDRAGVMQIFRMNDRYELLGTAEIGEKANATPAFAGDRIYIRGESHLFCIAEQK